MTENEEGAMQEWKERTQYERKLERNGCATAPNGCTYKLVQDRPKGCYSVWITSPSGERRQIVTGYNGLMFESLTVARRWAYGDGCLEYAPGLSFTERAQIA